MQETMYTIHLHSLTLSTALLFNCRVDEDDQALYPIIVEFMRDVVLPGLNVPSELIEALSLKSYALFMLMSQKTSRDHSEALMEFLG